MASRYSLAHRLRHTAGSTKWEGQHHACLVHHRSIPRVWRADRRGGLEGRRRRGRDARDPSTVTARLGNHERLLAHQLDVTSEAEAHEAAGQAVKKFGRIDSLVNNAGYGRLARSRKRAARRSQKLFGTNVIGLLGVTRAVLPHMRRQRSGRIIKISSVADTRLSRLGRLWRDQVRGRGPERSAGGEVARSASRSPWWSRASCTISRRNLAIAHGADDRRLSRERGRDSLACGEFNHGQRGDPRKLAQAS